MGTNLIDFVKLGGPWMGMIFLASITAVAVFFERWWFFHRCSIRMDEFLRGIFQLLRKHRYREALERCDEAYGPAVRVVQCAILKRGLPRSELREVVQEVAQLQMPRLENNMPMLAMIAYISPLLGLLGTVTGMIATFQAMNASMGASSINDLAGGIWESLLTTAGGLTVAVACYLAYHFLLARLHAIITDMERAGIETIQLLVERRGKDSSGGMTIQEELENDDETLLAKIKETVVAPGYQAP
jgi:biopolymer transport protein ExbB